ncbi:RNA polymerase sigma factor [Tautonia plasticadhaerens]|uniref:ECF RNA polymerase sigma factor SigW n=1 Tax=Tautonia plasticadhaerens TaxID=2527974 RepID=A0A518HDX9_9BACT|nr:sigma-70 family RNA polymerase sigma factor [Tautonia plasticadhaerens]QDV39059.1 ECF RNA polymerase sigma factor SigW [Tautonia plasticadhaerens]
MVLQSGAIGDDLAMDDADAAPPTDRPRSPLAEEASDARLVERAREGDEDAFAALVSRYERKLLRVLSRLVHDHELARDLSQETFWRVYNRLDRFDTGRRFGPWLFRVAVNLGVDQLRRRDAPPTTALPIESRRDDDPRGSSPGEVADPDPRPREELAQEVRHVLEQIPVNYRTILVLRDLEGFSSAEVAAIVRRREATVRWRLAKAREQFRRLWERRMQQQDQGGTEPMLPLPLPIDSPSPSSPSPEARHAD